MWRQRGRGGGRAASSSFPPALSREAQKLQSHSSFGTGMVFGVSPVCFPVASAEEVGRSEGDKSPLGYTAWRLAVLFWFCCGTEALYLGGQDRASWWKARTWDAAESQDKDTQSGVYDPEDLGNHTQDSSLLWLRIDRVNSDEGCASVLPTCKSLKCASWIRVSFRK